MDRAILAAAMGLLARDGYQALSMAAVADAAGVGRPTLYRRYASKAQLVAAALDGMTSGPEPELPDDTREALRKLVRAAAAALGQPGALVVIGSLLARPQEPELLAALRARIFDPRHAVVERVVQRGISSGDLAPSTMPDVVIDVLFGAILARLVFAEPVTATWLDSVVELVVTGAGGRP